ncbi:MAG: response regulator [Pyrinomonadaceae bacterium]
MKILIAEDDPVSRRVLAPTLTKFGYEVAMAVDGAQAWALLQQEKESYSVVSACDGKEAYRILNSDANFAAAIFEQSNAASRSLTLYDT